MRLSATDDVDAQIRRNAFRHQNAAVGLLVIFDDRHPGASDRESAAIRRVDEIRLLPSPDFARMMARRA